MTSSRNQHKNLKKYTNIFIFYSWNENNNILIEKKKNVSFVRMVSVGGESTSLVG